jgi:hypothetical protein
MGGGPIFFQTLKAESKRMKTLSVIFTLLLLVLASHLAVRLKKAGALPEEGQRPPPPLSHTVSGSQLMGSLEVNPHL